MSDEAPSLDRLDSALLEEAMRAANTLVRGSGDRWSIRSVEQRPNAELFRMQLLQDDAAIAGAYYKRNRAVPWGADPADDEVARRAQQMDWRLTHVLDLTNQFNAEADAKPIAMAPVLAVDRERRTEITLEVVGKIIRRDVRWFPPRSLAETIEFGTMLGQSVRCLENGRCPPIPALEPDWDVGARVAKLKGVLSGLERSRLEGLVLENERAATNQCVLVPCHGDFNTLNIFRTPSGLTLIDAMWFFRFPGYDLVRFSIELDYGPADWRRQWKRHRRELLAAMRTGYGEESLGEQPAWVFRRLMEVMRIASPGREGAGRQHASRRAKSIRRMLKRERRERARDELLSACQRSLH